MTEPRPFRLTDAREIEMIPHNAICFFRDGDNWCCVLGDFINLQESPAGFGDTFNEALADLGRRSGLESVANLRLDDGTASSVV